MKNDDSYEDGDLKGLHPCDCWYFRDVRNVRGVKIDDSYEDGGLRASKTTGVGGGGNTIGVGGAGDPSTENIYTHFHIHIDAEHPTRPLTLRRTPLPKRPEPGLLLSFHQLPFGAKPESPKKP